MSNNSAEKICRYARMAGEETKKYNVINILTDMAMDGMLLASAGLPRLQNR
jgi:hypothetical protein